MKSAPKYGSLPTEHACLIAVQGAGSFTDAAQQLGISPSAVSKAIRRLEMRLDCRLIDRTTRHIALTSDAEMYLEKISAIYDEMRSLDESIKTINRETVAEISVCCPTFFARQFLVSAISNFLKKYPNIAFRIDEEDKPTDDFRNYDIIISGKPPKIERSLSRKIFSSPRGLYVGKNHSLFDKQAVYFQDIQEKNFIIFGFSETQKRIPLLRQGGIFYFEPRAVCAVSTSQLAIDLAVAGAGVIQIIDHAVSDHVKSGRLKRLNIKKYVSERVDFYAIQSPLAKSRKVTNEFLLQVSKEISSF
ncbi:MAG: LysR family transcriptional regulator [Pseudomonadota bacterium]